MLIGIDGGGTWIRATALASLSDSAPRTVSYREPGNFLSLGPGGLGRVIENLRTSFDLADTSTVRVIIGLAGAGAGDALKQIGAVFVEKGYRAENVHAMTDADLGMKALEDEGILVISGTGAICIGRSNGTFERAGGWGFLVDNDYGSGYHLGQLSLQRIIRAREGVWPSRDGMSIDEYRLEEAVLEHFGAAMERKLEALADIRPYLYAQPLDKGKIAALAPLVFELAANGNTAAIELLGLISTALAELAGAVCRRMNPASPMRLGLWGGLFTNPDADRLLVTPLLQSPAIEAIREKFVPVPLYREDGPETLLTRAIRFHFAA